MCLEVHLFDWSFTQHSRIFHSYNNRQHYGEWEETARAKTGGHPHPPAGLCSPFHMHPVRDPDVVKILQLLNINVNLQIQPCFPHTCAL